MDNVSPDGLTVVTLTQNERDMIALISVFCDPLITNDEMRKLAAVPMAALLAEDPFLLHNITHRMGHGAENCPLHGSIENAG